MRLETEKEVTLEKVKQETELERQKMAVSEGKAGRSGLLGEAQGWVAHQWCLIWLT